MSFFQNQNKKRKREKTFPETPAFLITTPAQLSQSHQNQQKTQSFSDNQKQFNRMNHELEKLSNQVNTQNLLIQELYQKLKNTPSSALSQNSHLSQKRPPSPRNDPPSYII